MFRRAVSLITLGAFLVSTSSCVLHQTMSASPEAVATSGESFSIKALLTKAGERISFANNSAAMCRKDRLYVSGPGTTFEIAEADVEKLEMGGGENVKNLSTRNGRAYDGRITARKAGTITIRVSNMSIPLADVDVISIERVDGGKTFVATLGITAGVVAGVVVLIALLKSSCPFVYSFDGSGYTLDAEPYGGATSPGLKRTEWGRLNHLKEVGGEYRLKVTNEVDETQYTDELKLVVVDHPRGVSVVADEAGALHSVAVPVLPARAVDTRGRDILSYVKDGDWVYWQSADRDIDPELANGVKEKLTFEFPKPAGATRARLVFDGCNTVWASRMVKGYLALHGRELGDYYASLATPGPAQFGLQAWNLREELYRLHVRVLTTKGWVSKGTVAGGGPFVSRDKLYSLDIADVPGDVLTIELTPPIGFWMINHLAVDYGEDVAIRVREIEAVRAVDSRGLDVKPLLASTDNRYFAMPQTGDTADIVFHAPPRVDGLDRSVILKTSGYYDIHMGSLGDPQSDTLNRVRAEPGFSVRYAWGEYKKWQAEQLAGTAR